MPQNTWTINNAGGGRDASDLVGCHIQRTSTGYDFTSPSNQILASTTDTTLPFSFNDFGYDGWEWTVTVDTLTSGASGSWENNNPDITGEEGTWSAGAGTDPKSKTRKTTKGKTRAAGK